MKKSLLLCLLAFTLGANAQTPGCGEDKVMEIQRSNLSNYDEIVKQVNLHYKDYIAKYTTGSNANKSSSSSQVSSTNYVIPVVFHIVHPAGQGYGTGVNISYAQIQSQVSALNAAFAKNYPSYNGQTHPSYAQNTNIQFCLAKIAAPSSVSFYNGPTGIENGVMRYPNSTLTNHQITNASANALLGLTHPTSAYFPFGSYLNIWVVSSIGSGGSGTTMGYAPTPIINGYPLDGVIMRSDVIGDNSTGNSFSLGYGLTQGKVLVHEVGHYLNLYHIFQGGCSGANAAGSSTDACDLNGDFVCDTEPCTTQNYSCSNPIPNTCSATYPTGTTNMDMINSYMSYADDDCMNTFTSGQTLRMQTTLNTLRNNLWQTSNLSATGIIGPGGCMSPFLMSTILINTNNVCKGSPVVLSNPVLGNTATSYTWTLPGGSPAMSNASSVTVTYANAGLYWAKLKVSDGTITAKDSMLIKVANCTLDSTRLNRANWFFSDYCGINFNTVPASPIYNPNMYKGYEATVSMSDNKGNLLFYTNCINFWNSTHAQVNTISPFLNVTFTNSGSSTPGVIAIPYPKDSSRYILISSPHTAMDYDSVYYAVYNVNTNVLGPKRGFKHTSLPIKYSEPLTVVPHCNGRDYWVICRPYYNIANSNRAYSILITPAGPGQIDKVVVSNSITPAACGMFKSNRAGTRLLQCDFSTTLGKLYKFDKSSGVLSNETQIPGFGSGTSTGGLFSPNDSIAVIMRTGNDPIEVHQVNVITLATQSITVPLGTKSNLMELGPDNNIYLSQSDYNSNTMHKIINSNIWGGMAVVQGALTYTAPSKPFHGICNFMDADKGPEISIDFMLTAVNCNTYKFMVDSCWRVYTANWSFGDGTTGTGLTINHTYSTPGAYSATLVLSVGSYSLPPVVKNITVLSSTTSITGPSALCLNSTFINSYGVSIIPGATYNWSASNSTISGPNNQPNVNVATSGAGVATLSVQIVNGGCTSIATKTITIDPGPTVSIVPQVKPICIGDSILINANPTGGVLSGTGVYNGYFHSSVTGAGVFPISYLVTNANGCSNTAAITVTVSQCVGLKEQTNDDMNIVISPNPTNGIFSVNSLNGFIENVSIFNVLGQKIYSTDFKNEKNVSINLSDYRDGIYVVEVKSFTGLVVKRVIKKD